MHDERYEVFTISRTIGSFPWLTSKKKTVVHQNLIVAHLFLRGQVVALAKKSKKRTVSIRYDRVQARERAVLLRTFRRKRANSIQQYTEEQHANARNSGAIYQYVHTFSYLHTWRRLRHGIESPVERYFSRNACASVTKITSPWLPRNWCQP